MNHAQNELPVNEFKTNFCTTLELEPQNKTRFVIIPVDNYKDLNAMSYYLINAIDLISQANEHVPQENDDLSYTIQYITHILKHLSLFGECEGIDKLLKI